MIKILLLGPEKNKKDIIKTGGIIVLYEDLLRWLKQNNYIFFSIDTNKSNYSNKLYSYFSILFQVISKISSSDLVLINGTANDYLFIAPVVVFLSKFFKKKVVLRKFAGDFNTFYNELGVLRKIIVAQTLKSADLLLWETKYLVKFGKQFNSNNGWFPNVRTAPDFFSACNEFNNKFVFISHVSKEKGVLLLNEASMKISKEIKIGVYGQLYGDVTEEELSKHELQYKGPLKNEAVLQILKNYSVLVLPSMRKREGYPGIIIEAFSLGIPVIASRIGGIPEIVDDGVNGVLIEPGNVDQLVDAINFFNKNNYLAMSKSAKEKFKKFDSDIVTAKIFNQIFSGMS